MMENFTWVDDPFRFGGKACVLGGPHGLRVTVGPCDYDDDAVVASIASHEGAEPLRVVATGGTEAEALAEAAARLRSRRPDVWADYASRVLVRAEVAA